MVTLISALNAIAGGISVGQVSVFLELRASQYAKPFNEISGVVTELQKRAHMRLTASLSCSICPTAA